jgi:uncharacterized protein
VTRDPGAAALPSDAQIRALHEAYAPTPQAFESVYTHCQIVCRVAEQLLAARAQSVDLELVRAGCLLHDIGVYLLYGPDGRLDQASYIRHGILGHGLLRELGFPELFCRFCSCHTGVGLSRDDVVTQALPLPLDDYVARSDEERLVMYADKFHTKSTPPAFVAAASYALTARSFGADKVARFDELLDQFGEPDLAPLAREFGQPIV